MLLKLFVIFSSTSAVLSQYEVYPASQNLPKFEEPNPVPSEFNDSETVVAPLAEQTTNTICPANEVLVQIKNILTKLLDTEDENNNNDILKDMQQDDGFLNKDSTLNIENGIENLVLPLSKRKTLRQLLENNNLKSNFKTKITVEYEVPNEPDVSCKQTLSSILQVLRNANLLHESSRSCGPYDVNCPKENTLDMKNIGNQNVFTTNINQGNSNFPPNTPSLNYQNSIESNSLLGSAQDFNSILKYLAWNKRNPDLESILKNYRSKEQSVLNDIQITNAIPKSIEKLPQVFDKDGISELIQNNQTNLSDKSTPYQLHITENIVSPTNPNKINNQNLNISEILEGNSVQGDISFENSSQILGVDEKPNDVLVTVTNDGKVVSVYPSKDKLYENNVVNDKILTDYATKLQNKESVASHVKNLLNLYLQGNVNNLPRDKISAILAVLKTGGSKSQYIQFPPETTINEKYQNIKPYYINPNLFPSNIKPYSMINTGPTNSVREIPYEESLNDQLHANLNVFNQISNQGNLLPIQNKAYQTPYVTGNPYVVNSKLVDYGKHVNQLHAPYNLDNLQRLVGETNQVKLNSAPDNSGVVELTYLLKRPNPVVYQPVYFVKYRLPYDSFVKNLRDLVRRQPQLRSNRAKLYQELLALSKVAEVSPNLKGLGQQQLLHMVANNGALVKTKVLKVNETLLDKQLKTVQDLNSKLPKEIGNITYTGELYGDNKSGLLNNETQETVLNKRTKIEGFDDFAKAKLTSSNFNGRDIFNSFKTVTHNYSDISTDYPTNSMYPLV